MFSRKMVDDIVFMMNGHFWRGLGRLIADAFRNSSANSKFKNTIKPNDKTKIQELWEKRNDEVNPALAWGIYGGTLAIAIILALIFWL